MRLHTPLAALVLLGSATSLPAALLFDFGPTAPTGAETNSPFHVATGSTESTWNVIGTADTSSLLSSDGSAATGLSLDLGASILSGSIVNLANQPDNSNTLGVSVNGGVFAGTSVGRDGIYEGASGSTLPLSVGFQLTGLAAGTYDIYLITRNTNTSAGYTMTSFAAGGLAGADFDHSSGYSSQALTYPNQPNGATSAWELGVNYTKLTVSLEEGQALNVAVSAEGNQVRGFLNSAAIVAVPEPASVVSLFGGLGVLLGFRRMRRS